MACGFPTLFGRPPTPPPLHVRWWWSSHSPFFSRASVSFLLTWQEKMKGKKWACSSRLALGKKLFLLINFLNDSCTLAKIQMLLLCLFYFLLQHNYLRTILETNKRVAVLMSSGVLLLPLEIDGSPVYSSASRNHFLSFLFSDQNCSSSILHR